jgi:hypothetical protein
MLRIKKDYIISLISIMPVMSSRTVMSVTSVWCNYDVLDYTVDYDAQPFILGSVPPEISENYCNLL